VRLRPSDRSAFRGESHEPSGAAGGFTHAWVVTPHQGLGQGRGIPSTVKGLRVAELVYELSFKGAASDTLAAAFSGCDVTAEHGVTTVRSGVPDQAALQGLLARVGALGLELLEVRLVAMPTGDDNAWGHTPGHQEEPV
jgi:hypothetical protein